MPNGWRGIKFWGRTKMDTEKLNREVDDAAYEAFDRPRHPAVQEIIQQAYERMPIPTTPEAALERMDRWVLDPAAFVREAFIPPVVMQPWQEVTLKMGEGALGERRELFFDDSVQMFIRRSSEEPKKFTIEYDSTYQDVGDPYVWHDLADLIR